MIVTLPVMHMVCPIHCPTDSHRFNRFTGELCKSFTFLFLLMLSSCARLGGVLVCWPCGYILPFYYYYMPMLTRCSCDSKTIVALFIHLFYLKLPYVAIKIVCERGFGFIAVRALFFGWQL